MLVIVLWNIICNVRFADSPDRPVCVCVCVCVRGGGGSGFTVQSEKKLWNILLGWQMERRAGSIHVSQLYTLAYCIMPP